MLSFVSPQAGCNSSWLLLLLLPTVACCSSIIFLSNVFPYLLRFHSFWRSPLFHLYKTQYTGTCVTAGLVFERERKYVSSTAVTGRAVDLNLSQVIVPYFLCITQEKGYSALLKLATNIIQDAFLWKFYFSSSLSVFLVFSVNSTVFSPLPPIHCGSLSGQMRNAGHTCAHMLLRCTKHDGT